jgi:Uncharacterized conserved protein (COG2071)
MNTTEQPGDAPPNYPNWLPPQFAATAAAAGRATGVAELREAAKRRRWPWVVALTSLPNLVTGAGSDAPFILPAPAVQEAPVPPPPAAAAEPVLELPPAEGVPRRRRWCRRQRAVRKWSRGNATTVTAQLAHNPWPLHTAELLGLNDNLIETTGLPTPSGPPASVLYSPGVRGRLGLPPSS